MKKLRALIDRWFGHWWVDADDENADGIIEYCVWCRQRRYRPVSEEP